jgi:hypothetical protein
MADAPTKPPFDVKALAEVANRVNLDSVTLTHLKATRTAELDSRRELMLGFEYRTSWKRQDERPGIDVTFEIDARLDQPSGDEGGSPSRVVDVSIALMLSYGLPEVAPSDWNERFALFARVNAPVNAWPYARSELQSTLVKMNLPPLLLPVYRPGRAAAGKIEYAKRKHPSGRSSRVTGAEEAKKT